MKKILSLFLALLMIFSCVPISASVFAEATEPTSAPIIKISETYGKLGKNVNVDVKVSGNPGIAGAKLTFSFPDELKLVSAANGKLFDDTDFTMPNNFKSPCSFTWERIDGVTAENGTLLTLTFEIPSNAECYDKFNVSATYKKGDFFNELDGEAGNVSFVISNGSVEALDFLPGDVNDDGVVNGKDIRLIRQFNSTGYDVTINERVGDVNDDGVVNGKDVRKIRRYFAGGYDELLYPSHEKCRHDAMTAVAAKAATCTENGNIAYWHCASCDKYFSDADAGTEITLDETVIKANGHTVVIDPAVPADYEHKGLTEGSHCSVCGEVLVPQNDIPMLQGREHGISYDIANGDSYIEGLILKNQISNNNPDRYNEETGLTLKNLSVAGYRFLGWYDGASSNAVQIKKIEQGSTEEYELYAHWEEIEYTVQYKSSLFVEKESDTYTVSTGLTLPTPKLSNYYFLGWSDENGKLCKNNVLPAGTTGNITLSGNWTSERNKTWAKPQLDEPVIHIDEDNNIVLFAYEIGKIENVPLYTIKDFGYIAGDGVTRSETATYQTTISESNMQSYAQAVSSATTESSSWSLADTWNDIITIDEEACQEKGITTEEAESRAKNETNNWNISTGKSGSTDTTHLETNQSGWESGGKITENRGHSKETDYNEHYNFSLNGSFGIGGTGSAKASKKGLEAVIGSALNVGANIGTDNGKSYSEKYNQSWQAGLEIARKNTGLSVTSDTTVTKSAWNNSSSYGGSSSTSASSSTSKALSEKISKKYGYGKSYANGGTSSSSQGLTSVQSSSDEYSSSVTYATSSMNSVTSSWTTQATKPGYHRWIVAGTAHVFGVVGYDMSTKSFFVYTYSVMDDETHEFEDYSYSTSSYDDQQNGVIPFEIPYDVVEHVAELTTYSAGLKVNQNTGIITGYTRPEGSEDNVVVIPEYMNVGNGDVVKVTGISSNAFKGNTEIEAVILSNYITEIPDCAFEGCTSLSTVIGGSITSIGKRAFNGCTAMDIFGVCNLVTKIGNDAFNGIRALTVNAANVNIVKAAINSGAKIIDIHVGYIENGASALNGVVLTVPATTEMFSFNGYNATYDNFSIVSNAKETRIHKTNFVSSVAIPLKINSADVILNQVTVKSAGLGLVLAHDNTKLGLQGNVTVSSDNVNAVLCKNATLYDSNENVEGKLIVSDKILICGDITGKNHLQYDQYEQISAETFDNLLNSYTLKFDANATNASCAEDARKVPNASPIGVLPIPTRTGFIFDGWFTAPSGGTKVDSSTTFATANDVTLYAHWTVKSFSANWSNGTGCSIIVTRTSSPNKGAETGVINSGATVYYGDVLNVTYTASTGYTLKTKGSTSITVTEDITGHSIFATATVNSYTAIWSTGSGYTISVKRTASPKAGASTGVINSGATVYYGDVLNVTYTASTGYILKTKGSTSITVTGNVNGSSIYATAAVNSYTYNIVYKSSNGTDLGSSSATFNYGTTNTISPPVKNGYNTPSAQSVRWDSASGKTITFIYTPTSQPTRQVIATGNWWKSNSGNTSLDYVVEAEWRNRTANSVEIRIIWTNTITNNYGQGKYGYKQEFEWWGWHQIAAASKFNTAGGTRTASNSSGWQTYSCTPDDVSQNTGSEWRDNNGKSGSWSGTVYFPKY